MQKITPFLWFNDNAEEAMNFYCGIFTDAKILSTQRMNDKLLMGSLQLNNQTLMLLNGGPKFTFTEAVSLFVSVETQDEVDHLWTKLTADGGSPSQCGWLKDKFGLSWQIVPTALMTLMGDKDREKAGRVMQAMLKMQTIVIADLQAAYDGT